MTEIVPNQGVIADRNTALELIETAISTLDPRPLEGIVDRLMTPEFEDSLSIMAVSGDEPNMFEQFLVLCEDYGLITEAEMIEFVRRFVVVSRDRAA
ncbi:MAG: hypothetical protein FWD68_17830 [Alphaproteobacteria bacterium]|nr:hypothetical protein [Alphaproteobacteria bacterium]